MDAWGDWVQFTGTCLSLEAMDAAISPVWDFLIDKAADAGEELLIKLVALGDAAYRQGRTRLNQVDRLLRTSGSGDESVEAAYAEGVRIVKKPIVVAEPVPSHVKAVVADLAKLATDPNAPGLTVVPKDGIVVPGSTYTSPPPPATAPVANPGPACRAPGECPDYGSQLGSSVRAFWTRLRCPLPFTESALILTEKPIPSLRKSALRLKPTDAAVMTPALLAEITATGPKVKVTCNQAESSGGRAIINYFYNFGALQLEQVIRVNSLGQLDGEATDYLPLAGGVLAYAWVTYKDGLPDGPYLQGRKSDGVPFEAGQYKAGKSVGDITKYWGAGLEPKVVTKYSQTGDFLSVQQFSKSGVLCPGPALTVLVQDNPQAPGYGNCLYQR